MTYEKKEGGANRERMEMRGFREVMDDCDLHDWRFVGQWYTWKRGDSLETRIRKRLDRFFVFQICCNYSLRLILSTLFDIGRIMLLLCLKVQCLNSQGTEIDALNLR